VFRIPDADPDLDLAFHCEADPDSTFHCAMDPDPTFNLNAALQPLAYRPSISQGEASEARLLVQGVPYLPGGYQYLTTHPGVVFDLLIELSNLYDSVTRVNVTLQRTLPENVRWLFCGCSLANLFCGCSLANLFCGCSLATVLWLFAAFLWISWASIWLFFGCSVTVPWLFQSYPVAYLWLFCG
jgi:hypothetical protein